MTGPRVRRHVWVSGRVQGVWFRESCRRQAAERGVAGWVGNCADGRVEAVFEGPPDAVDEMVEWCRTGPPHARVTAVSTEEEPASDESGFVVR